MHGQFWLFIVLIFLTAVGAISMAFASPSAQLERSIKSNVVADNTATIQLTPSSSYGMVQIEQQGKLSISPQNVGADSINTNSILSLGDQSQPEIDYAFRIENPKSQPVMYTFSLSQATDFSGSSGDVEYNIQKNGSTTRTLIADGTEETFVVNPGETVYVSVRMDTTATRTGNLDTVFYIKSSVSN